MAMTSLAGSRRDFSAFIRNDADGAARLDLLVRGARCAACISKIEREVTALPPVRTARMNLTTGKLSVFLNHGATDADTILETLAGAGYPATPYDPTRAAAVQDAEGRRLALALGVAAFGAGNAMMFSVPIWAGLFGQELGPATRTMMQWMSAAVGAPCAVYAGTPFFTSAWRSLSRGRANMDVPISIGVLLTLAISFVETILGGVDTYFDAAVSLLFLLLIGRWLDHRLRTRANTAARDILALQAPSASVLDAAGLEHMRPVGDVRPGDLLLVRPGGRIPVDGRVEHGVSALDNALLSGEATPVQVKPGSVCRAGALNLTGLLHLRASARAEDSTVADIARLLEAGAEARSRYVQIADKAAALYVPVVHSAALLTFMGALLLDLGAREALLRAVAVLIITCPCALGLAAPAVQVSASARLFRRGVLVKSGAGLERLAEIDHVVLDKTGVLTLGQPRLVNVDPAAVALAAPLALASSHPLSRALAREAHKAAVAQQVIETAGQGVEGLIGGRRARLGRASFVGLSEHAARETELWFAVEDDPKICFTFQDALRPDAAVTIAALRRRGLSLEILSGDRPEAVRQVANALGVEAFTGAMTPEEKAAAVRRHTEAGRRVLMIGDGLNDAAALAFAHAAIAPGSALDASQNAADLVFSGERLHAVVDAYDIARTARRRAFENFVFAALYNVIAAPVAMLGLINPFVAALAMSGSSLAVTLNALRMGPGRRS